jgi:uncharacterized protein DUF3606
MRDSFKNREPADAKRVNLNEPWEVRYWCRKWGCTPGKLKEIVHAVGTEAEQVDRAFAAEVRVQ